jgi:isoleucyl-tRNA synthetase
MQKVPDYVSQPRWSQVSEGDINVFVDSFRDTELLSEGLVRDVARRIQNLRKDLGYVPSDVLSNVQIAGLGKEQLKLVSLSLELLKSLVRANKVHLTEESPSNIKDWREFKIDSTTIYLSIT